MAKTQKINTDYSLRFNSREDDTGDTVMDLCIDFSNPKDTTVVIERLNTWLAAIGHDLVVVPKK